MTTPAGPTGTRRYCGRGFTPAELDTIRTLATSLPTRAQIAEALCQALDWRRPDGATKAMSARVACLRMAADGLATRTRVQIRGLLSEAATSRRVTAFAAQATV